LTKNVSHKKVFVFSLFVLSQASNNTTSPNIWEGTDARAVPPPQIFLGGRPPVPSKFPPMVSELRD